MVDGAAGDDGAVAAILVGIMEMVAESGKCFQGVVFAVARSLHA